MKEKQIRFCREYVVDYNGTQAAIRAGYSEKTAAAHASRLLKSPEIIGEIKKNQKMLLESSCLTEEKVINRLQEVLDICTTAAPVIKWDYDEHRFVESGTYEINAKGAIEAIKLLGKHLGMFTGKGVATEERQDDGFIEALKSEAGSVWQE